MKERIRQQLSQYFKDKPVYRAYLFGSVVRNDANKDSDIDILVELDYENGADYFVFFDMQQQLNQLLNKKVDIVSAKGLSRYIQPIIDKEKVLIYEKQGCFE